MSQSIPSSKASTLAPLAVIDSFSSRSSWMSWARSARKTSPEPETFIRSTPSPVIAFFMNFIAPPEPACSNLTSPWWATIEPSLAWIVAPESSTLSIFEFWSENDSVVSVSLSLERVCSTDICGSSCVVNGAPGGGH